MVNKNILIGDSTIEDVRKIKTYIKDDGLCYWVPEDGTTLSAINITSDGVYKAAEQGYYGFSEVNVNGQGNSIIGDKIIKQISIDKNGSYTYNAVDDNHYSYSEININVDVKSKSDVSTNPYSGGDNVSYTDPETGKTAIIPLPDYIRVETVPNKNEYEYGSEIDYTGIEVYAYTRNGQIWRNDDYQNGRIPYDELILPVKEAGAGLTNDVSSEYSSSSQNSRINHTITMRTPDKTNYPFIIMDNFEDGYYRIYTSDDSIRFMLFKCTGDDIYVIVAFTEKKNNQATVSIYSKTQNNNGTSTGTQEERLLYSLSATTAYKPVLPFNSTPNIYYATYTLSSIEDDIEINEFNGSESEFKENNAGYYCWYFIYNKNKEWLQNDDYFSKYGLDLNIPLAYSFEMDSTNSTEEINDINLNYEKIASDPEYSGFKKFSEYSLSIFPKSFAQYLQDNTINKIMALYETSNVIYDEKKYIIGFVFSENTDYITKYDEEAIATFIHEYTSTSPYEYKITTIRESPYQGGVYKILLSNNKYIYATTIIVKINGVISNIDGNIGTIYNINNVDDVYEGSSTMQYIRTILANLLYNSDIYSSIERQSVPIDGSESTLFGNNESISQMIRVGWKRPKDDKQLNTTFPITVTARIDEGWEEP